MAPDRTDRIIARIDAAIGPPDSETAAEHEYPALPRETKVEWNKEKTGLVVKEHGHQPLQKRLMAAVKRLEDGKTTLDRVMGNLEGEEKELIARTAGLRAPVPNITDVPAAEVVGYAAADADI